jgi:signal transduction histidine kinase
LALPVALFAQDDAPTLTVVLAMPDDTVKVLKLSDLCFAYRRVDADSALMFGERSLRLAERLRFQRGVAQACNDMAIIHIDRSRFSTADSLLQRALRIRTELRDSAGMGAIHNKLGNVHQAQFKLEEALQQNLAALHIFERIGPPAKEALILNNIAILQFNMRRYAEALKTHAAAAAIRERIGDGQGLAESKGNMANVEVVLGDTGNALRHFAEAADHFRANGLERELAVQLHNEAGVRLSMGLSGLAEKLFREALMLREAVGEPKAIASTLTGLADTEVRNGRAARALPLARRALVLAAQVGARNERMQAMLALARAHAHLGHGDSTFWYQERYGTLRDSVFNADMAARMAELDARYDTERKERMIEQQRADLAAQDLRIAELARDAERRRFWLAFSFGGIGVLFLSGLLVLQVQRRRARAAQDAALLAEREQGLRAVVAGTEAERARIARELHDGIGQQLAGLKFRVEELKARLSGVERSEVQRLDDVVAITDDTARDVREIAHGMMPRALGTIGLMAALTDMLGKAFGSSGTKWTLEQVGAEGRFRPELEVGVYRILQELTANILKHAQATEVQVQVLRNSGHLIVMVTDNGRGFDPAVLTGGIGLGNMRDRARLLGGSLRFDTTPGTGTTATLRVPLGMAPQPG